MEVTLGDYSVFLEDSKMLREKDWSKRPEPDEVHVWRMWYRIQEPFDQLLNPLDPTDTEPWAGRYVANELGWSEEKVHEALMKVTFWIAT